LPSHLIGVNIYGDWRLAPTSTLRVFVWETSLPLTLTEQTINNAADWLLKYDMEVDFARKPCYRNDKCKFSWCAPADFKTKL